jgi:hypothetical protein
VLRHGAEAENGAKTYVMDEEIFRERNKFMTELRTEDGAGLKKINSF